MSGKNKKKKKYLYIFKKQNIKNILFIVLYYFYGAVSFLVWVACMCVLLLLLERITKVFNIWPKNKRSQIIESLNNVKQKLCVFAMLCSFISFYVFDCAQLISPDAWRYVGTCTCTLWYMLIQWFSTYTV